MAELSKVLRKMKLQRGEICFDVKEAKIIVDEECKPIEIGERERGTSEKMIEDFMIVANETVAEYITNFGYPMMYRIHEAPREKKLKEFLKRQKIKFENLKPTIWFEVEDVAIFYKEMLNNGIKFLSEPFKIGTGNAVEFEDPFGNRLGVTDYIK